MPQCAPKAHIDIVGRTMVVHFSAIYQANF